MHLQPVHFVLKTLNLKLKLLWHVTVLKLITFRMYYYCYTIQYRLDSQQKSQDFLIHFLKWLYKTCVYTILILSLYWQAHWFSFSSQEYGRFRFTAVNKTIQLQLQTNVWTGETNTFLTAHSWALRKRKKKAHVWNGSTHEKNITLMDKVAARRTTAKSMKSTKICVCWRKGWAPGCSSSTDNRAREALSVLLSGSAYWGPRGSTIQRNTLTLVSIWSIMWEMRPISRSMALRSSRSSPDGRFGFCRSGRLSARAATSLPPPALRKTRHGEKKYLRFLHQNPKQKKIK